MITETNRLCSDKQSLGTTAGTTASTNVLDNGTNTRVYDGTLHFVVKLDNADSIAGGDSIRVKVQTSNNESFSTSGSGVVTDLVDTGAIAIATAKAKPNGVLVDETLNDKPGILRYVRAQYITVGTTAAYTVGPVVTAGEFTEAAPTHVKDFTSAPPANV